ncbi:MAG: hypothetical protein CME33_13980 [Gimesia sp.]|uniref:hypothetical protein n=1 Tax=Gimesia sp. TaxID=2024833 RepID=UPI000C38F1E5|nr:hypothetical protein [Gimesia sp.]MAX37662.1 hypothetical protein [Gimesia sp.]|tara:strand:+ start:7049 stop:7717 length:669 start_codon:yes stop_codon:yes gene_type:complete
MEEVSNPTFIIKPFEENEDFFFIKKEHFSMGIYISGYSIKLNALKNLSKDEKEIYLEMYIDELKKKELVEDDDELYFEESAMKQIFGFGNCKKERSDSLLLSIEWICENFGCGLGESVEMPPIYDLDLETRLSGKRTPPFGFPDGDENVSHLTFEQIKEERELLEGRDQEDFSYDPKWVFDSEKLAQAKMEWSDRILPARKNFLAWLDHCIREETDLVIIQS